MSIPASFWDCVQVFTLHRQELNSSSHFMGSYVTSSSAWMDFDFKMSKWGFCLE
jgi:hypothetical protein